MPDRQHAEEAEPAKIVASLVSTIKDFPAVDF
jgi:hypothetical protein